MKYHRLTHDQFNEVHEEFAVFLATQGLDRLRWNELKNANSPKIPQLLDLFSDVVWDKIISECTFLEFSTPDQLFLFKTLSSRATVIIVKRRNISNPNHFKKNTKKVVKFVPIQNRAIG